MAAFKSLQATRQMQHTGRHKELSSAGSSTTTAAVSSAQRYNHLIEEQRSLVLNAQEGLKQALTILNKTISEDDKESALEQVLASMSRCQDLVIKLKVVLYIRNELEIVQQQLIATKRELGSPTKLYVRQQWLEGRIEKLLLKRRGRPGARGQRTIAATKLPPLGGATAGHRPSLTHNKLITNYTTTQGGMTHRRTSTIGTCSSSADILSSARGGWPDEDESSERTSFVSSNKRRGGGGGGEGDSDYWNSEISEDKWTTVTQPLTSLIKGDVEAGMSELTTIKSDDIQSGATLGEEKEEQQQPLPSFETPRSLSIFGPNSWNILQMANYTSHMPPIESEEQPHGSSSPSKATHIDESPKSNDLIILWQQIKELQKQLLTVAKTLQTVTKNSINLTALGRVEDKLLKDHLFSNSEDDHFLHIPEKPKQYWSRRIYGKGVLRYPQLNPHTIIASSLHPTERKGATLKEERKSQLALKEGEKRRGKRPDTSIDLTIELSQYKLKCVKSLLHEVKESKLVDKRRDLVQLLGVLEASEHIGSHVLETLRETMVSDDDPIVKYEAVKSLISHGAWNNSLLHIVTQLFSKGTLEEQFSDLLCILTDKITLLELHLELLDKTLVDEFISALNNLLIKYEHEEGERESVSFWAAIAITNCIGLTTDCERKLRSALLHAKPHQQSLALEMLVRASPTLDKQLLNSAKYQIHSLINWKYRLKAVECMKHAGAQLFYEDSELLRFILNRLANEPVHVVKVAIGNLASDFGLKQKCESEIFKKLESDSEMERVEAVASLGSFINDSKIQSMLMDCVELDPSTLVRLTALASLSKAKSSLSSVIMSRLLSRCEGAGPVARQCRNVCGKLQSSF